MERPSLAHQPAIQPQLVTYNILIHTAAMARDILTAQRLYHSMLAKGIRADEYTYTTLLHCMAAMGDDHGVDDMLTHIQRDGNAHLLQNTVTWNVLLTCYYPAHPEKADNMFHRMCDALTGRTMGSECTETTETAEKDDPLHAAPPADGTTFQLHLDQLLDRHDYDTAVQIVLETMVPFCPPPLALYHRLFDTLKPSNALVDRAHGLTLLHQLVPSLKMIDITPVTLDTLIHALLDHGDTVFALETFVQLCQQHNITPHQPLLDRLHTVIQRMS
ncbi:hypothetical protein BC940DRAFT_319622 [Gongronella butleri]|nr:hypothetical protein BC940DRAFT_319622 [Gongronella butleri]